MQLSFLKKRSFRDYLFTELFTGTIVINWIEIYLSLANFHTKQAVFLIKKALTKKKLKIAFGTMAFFKKVWAIPISFP